RLIVEGSVVRPSQRVAHPAIRLGQPELDAACAERALQLPQELGPGEVEARGSSHVEHKKMNGVGPGLEQSRDAIAYVLDIEIEQRRLAPDHQHSQYPDVLRMAGGVTVVCAVWRAREFGHPGLRALPEQQH